MSEPDDLVDLELRVTVEVRHDRVYVRFGHPVWYLSIPSIEARGLAMLLLEKADELDEQPDPREH